MTDDNPANEALWGGRFSEPTDHFVQEFTASIKFDQRLAAYDIQGSIAHAHMLHKVGILTKKEHAELIQGLENLLYEIEANSLAWSVALEDVHMNIESRLIDRVGDVGKKLHTARSRNDQVATDIRLFMRDATQETMRSLMTLQEELLRQAQRFTQTIMPGFTHLQPAQPVTLGHHLMAWQAMLERDYGRFSDSLARLNQCPLGSAALAGTSFPIDRHYTAQLLGFDQPCENSLDAVSDRDFAIEFVSAASLMMVHFSRMCEELVLWTSSFAQFIQLPDRFCTGSSIMPQKKNPDVPELIRGKVGRVVGHLNSLLMLMKSQPLAYNKDNQEDKEPLFDVVDTVLDVLTAMTGVVGAIEANHARMEALVLKGHTTATDLADHLVREGVPFRQSHEIVGKVVALAESQGKDLHQLSLEQMQSIHPKLSASSLKVLSPEGSVNARNHFGGTAPEQVEQAISRAKERMKQYQSRLTSS